MVVYVDIIVLINFLIDLLLIVSLSFSLTPVIISSPRKSTTSFPQITSIFFYL